MSSDDTGAPPAAVVALNEAFGDTQGILCEVVQASLYRA